MHDGSNMDNKDQTGSGISPGISVGHYRIIREIGSGGMGDVFLAEDTELGREVALKFLRSDICRDEACRVRFKREAQTAAKLSHPNIVTIYEVSEYRERPFLVMEHVEGRSCQELIKRDDMDIEKIIDFTRQISEGLQEAHDNGIIHRDIKPSNIVIDSRGRCRLLDFGLAAVQGTEKITRSGYAIGTAGYMSPEQVNGEEADQRSDIFSLGVVLYEMITGRQPFIKDAGAATLHAIVSEQPEPMARYKTGITPKLQQVADKALEKDRDMRYQHVGDMLADLKRIKREMSLNSNETSEVYVISRPARRFPWLLPGSLIVSLLILALMMVLIPANRDSIKRLFGINIVPPKKHLAVLPFVNVGDNKINQAFCDGMMETLASKVTQLEQFQDSFWVIPASEVRESGIISAGQARRAFGVTLAVTGSVQLAGDEVRMTVNLIDAVNNRQLRSIIIDALLSNLAALQDSIVFEVAEMLEVQVLPEGQRLLTAGGTIDPRAYEFFLKGRGYLQHKNRENLDSAIVLFKRALARDTLYALAYAGLGEAYWSMYLADNDQRWIEPALDNCRRTMEISKHVPAAHVTMGLIYAGTGRYEEAIEQFKTAISIDPAIHEAYRRLADAYQSVNMVSEAEATYREVIRLKPDYGKAHYDLGLFYLYLGRFEDAVKQMDMVVELLPESDSTYNNVGALYYYYGQKDNARGMWERSLEFRPNYGAYSNLGSYHFMEHNYAEAAGMYEKALELNSRDYQVWANLASVYNQIEGMEQKAQETFRQAIGMAEDIREVNPRNPELLSHLAELYAMTGDGDMALPLINQALDMAPGNIMIMARAGIVHEKLGDRDNALELISKALDGGFPYSYIECLPELQGLIADPRFEYRSKSPQSGLNQNSN